MTIRHSTLTIALLISLTAFCGTPDTRQTQSPPDARFARILPGDHLKGPRNAPVTIIKYSDFQCHFCANMHLTLKQVKKKYKDKLNIVYRHYPLKFHPNAMPAALASECAAALGNKAAFWEYSDFLYGEGTAPAQLLEYAALLKLDKGAFKQCLDQKRYLKRIKENMAGGDALKLDGTPYLLILHHKSGKGQIVTGARDFNVYQRIIDDMLK